MRSKNSRANYRSKEEYKKLESMLQKTRFVHNGKKLVKDKLRHVKSKIRVRKNKCDFEKELSKVVKCNNRNLFGKHYKQEACQKAFRVDR